MGKMRIVIVGGVAGGATAAAHARRLSEDAEIVMFERGPYVSFANCGLPYYVGGEIGDKADLLVQTPEGLRSRFNLDVQVMTEVTSIDREAKHIQVRDLKSGETRGEIYDALILATGASPLKPPIPGIDREGHFTVRGVPDVEAIDAWIRQRKVSQPVIVGGGLIGLEMVEQLHRRGLSVTLVEALPQVMPPLDEEMAAWLHLELHSRGVILYLGDPVARFDPPGPNENAIASTLVLKSGSRIPADLVILGLGVRPETGLAQKAGLEIGERGGIRVDDTLRTSDPYIWALGDAIEVRDCVTGAWTLTRILHEKKMANSLQACKIRLSTNS